MKSATSYFNRFRDIVERVGNFLPHPASLFAIFALAVVVLSGIFASLDLSVSHPSTGETIEVISLLNLEGLHRMLTRMVTNFTSFAPLGTVFYSPEFVQAAYRIGDSVSNVVAPMMFYFALIVAFVAKYDPKAGMGSVIALMLPYTIVFTIVWSILLTIFILLGLPVGPGAGLYLPQ